MVLCCHYVDSFWLSWKLHSDLQLIGCFLISGAWWICLAVEQKTPTQRKDGSKTCDLGDLIGLSYKQSAIRIFFLTIVQGQSCEPIVDIDS